MLSFLARKRLTLRELSTKHISLVFRVFLAVHMYAPKAGQIRELFIHLLSFQLFPVSMPNGVWFLQLKFKK